MPSVASGEAVRGLVKSREFHSRLRRSRSPRGLRPRRNIAAHSPAHASRQLRRLHSSFSTLRIFHTPHNPLNQIEEACRTSGLAGPAQYTSARSKRENEREVRGARSCIALAPLIRLCLVFVVKHGKRVINVPIPK